MEWSWTKYKIINQYGYIKNDINHKFFHKAFSISKIEEYAGRQILGKTDTNVLIADMIKSEKPFMVCRFGGTEMNAIITYLQIHHFPYIDRRKQAISKLCKLSGFFPDDVRSGEKFVDLMLNASANIDLCGIWNLNMEDYIIDQYAPAAKLTTIGRLEPWFWPPQDVKPWPSALKGKKVLVIHPFDETISKQYHNYRTKLFEKKFDADDILPEFELITMKAVQTLNYNTKDIPYKDWFEALESMIRQCEKTDFDVAIIGCGAYGFPLAAAIKQMGKGAVHLGGVTQVLFGITGKRWESGSYKLVMDQITNEYWTRPLPSEKPQNADEIEGGCYW